MPQSTVHVACLCAGWCHRCDDYRGVLRSVAAEVNPCAADLQWHWIDIEDEADLVGEVDVETFPTLVIADGTTVRFAGPLTPHPDTPRRLLRAARDLPMRASRSATMRTGTTAAAASAARVPLDRTGLLIQVR